MTSGVYIFKLNDEIMYVGRSANLDERLAEHHYGFGCDIYTIQCNDEGERRKLEHTLITKLKPRLNGSHKEKVTSIDSINELGLPGVVKITTVDVRTCSHCGRRIRSDNSTGVCIRCQRWGIRYDKTKEQL